MKFSRQIALLLLGCFTVIVPIWGQAVDRSYYVSQNGNDDTNNGRSEEAPFASISKAIEMAEKGAVKKITVIGRINELSRIYYEGTTEILICGKIVSAENEQAAILAPKNKNESALVINGKGKLRIENIKILGGVEDSYTPSGWYEPAVVIEDTQVTLGDGVIVTNSGNGGIRITRGVLIMCGNANVHDNYGHLGAGVNLQGSKLFMLDNAVISSNHATNTNGPDGGGGIYVSSSYGPSFIKIAGNSKIINNTSERNGGGIDFAFITEEWAWIRKTPYLSVEDNASIEDNIAKNNGGGVYFSYRSNLLERDSQRAVPITISDTVSISNNRAKNGGGVYFSWRDINPLVLVGGKIKNNKAEYGAGLYYSGQSSISKSKYAGPYGETIILLNVIISENTADFVGGGIYLEKDSLLNRDKGTITNNIAGDGEGNDTFTQHE